jgi:hypothetical protein
MMMKITLASLNSVASSIYLEISIEEVKPNLDAASKESLAALIFKPPL